MILNFKRGNIYILVLLMTITLLVTGCNNSSNKYNDEVDLINSAKVNLLNLSNMRIDCVINVSEKDNEKSKLREVVINNDDGSWYTYTHDKDSENDINSVEQLYFNGEKCTRFEDSDWMIEDNYENKAIPVLNEITTFNFTNEDCKSVNVKEEGGYSDITITYTTDFINRIKEKIIEKSVKSLNDIKEQNKGSEQLINDMEAQIEQLKNTTYDMYKVDFIIDDSGVLVGRNLYVILKRPALFYNEVENELEEVKFTQNISVESYNNEENNEILSQYINEIGL